MKSNIKEVLQIIVEVLLIPYMLYKALKSRFSRKKIDIGLGPQPLINNIYHKKALELYGYSAETFASNPFYITSEFDIVVSDKFNIRTLLGQFKGYLFLIDLAFKYKVLYFYFNGGPLGVSTKFLWKYEFLFYKIAKVKTVVMPYGSDIQDMSRSENLYFKHTLNKDYIGHKKNRKTIEKKIDLWTQHADHIISGCEWVDYMYAWDTLTLAHFSIDVNNFDLEQIENNNDVFKIFHAPNHREIKGSNHLIKAIDELKAEGYDIELVMLSKVSNQEILDTIKTVDIVADQFVVGWYAMFALEAMSMGKPVICYLRDDLIELYEKAELIDKNEIPIINTNLLNIKERILWAFNNRKLLKDIGTLSRSYVKKHHSIEYIGEVFDKINKEILDGEK